jgi:hypothetical protein
MSSKTLIYLASALGSIIGGYAPVLWGGSTFSFMGLFCSGIGGIIGVVIAYKMTQ